jgi:hypothetical protein
VRSVCPARPPFYHFGTWNVLAPRWDAHSDSFHPHNQYWRGNMDCTHWIRGWQIWEPLWDRALGIYQLHLQLEQEVKLRAKREAAAGVAK